MTKKLYIKTFGCQMNEYDSDKMADVLRACAGMERTDRPEDADVILFNTCSIREKAEEKVFSDLGRVRPLKQARPDLLIGVGGCVASQEGEVIIKRASCRCGIWPADPASSAAVVAGSPRHREAAGGHQLSRDREI